jgi:hypothetical protein
MRSRTRRLIRYANIDPPIGSPIKVRRLPRTSAFRRSPSRLRPSTPMASRWPQRRPNQSPVAAAAQADATAIISTTAHPSMRANATLASGLMRHMGSSQGAGRGKASAVMLLTSAPAAKNALRAVTPNGRSAALGVWPPMGYRSRTTTASMPPPTLSRSTTVTAWPAASETGSTTSSVSWGTSGGAPPTRASDATSTCQSPGSLWT